MAQDPRRFVRGTLSEEMASWLEANFGGTNANKFEAIKTIIGNAMNANPPEVKTAPGAEANSPAAQTCAMVGAADALKIMSANLEMLIQTYMADHPEREMSLDLKATMCARWRSFIEFKRPAYMEKGGYIAP